MMAACRRCNVRPACVLCVSVLLAATLTFQFDGRDVPVTMPVVNMPGDVTVDIRLDTAAGAAHVTRVCSTSAPLPSAPMGITACLSMSA